MPTLTSKVYLVNKNGVKEETTVRDVLTLGCGTSFDTLKAMDCFKTLVTKLQQEKNRPLETLTENLRVARKNAEKAQWWMREGVYVLSPTEKDVIEASTEYEKARCIWQDAYNALSEATGQR